MSVLILRSLATGGGGGGGAGFNSRPYFFQEDATRLLASVTNSEPQATGSAANNAGDPLGFITLAGLKLSTPASYTDVPYWFWAVAGWASSNTTMRQAAAAACLAVVRANPDGTPLTGEEYQHIEDQMLETALVVDCCYNEFSAGERTEVADYVNGAMKYAGDQATSFWPGDNQPHNNYWQNQLLALALAGICSEGWNSGTTISSTLYTPAVWRTKFEVWAGRAVTGYTTPTWVGPQVSEGHYYSTYTANQLWALRAYDYVLGKTYRSQLSFTSEDALNHALYQIRPSNDLFFHIGSEAADVSAPMHGQSWQYWHMLMWLCGASSTNAKLAKAILTGSPIISAGSFWARSDKGFKNWMWPWNGITASALSAKTDRRLVLPNPGGGMTHIRSTQGWDTAATRRAAIVFHNKTDWTSGSSPGWSHANVDAPGFQWCQDNRWLVMDPEFRGSAGIDAEQGSAASSDLSNIVTLASAKDTSSTAEPIQVYNEDNTGAGIPHYYQAINAQPYWTMCTTYRREYVWLDDMQVVVVWDYVVTSGSNTKTFRLHIDGTVSVASSVATCSVTGGLTVKVRDLYTTTGGAMSQANNTPYSGVTRITQTDTANSFRSLKVLDVGGRCSAASLSSGAGYLQADMTINSVSRSVRFYDDGTHALVS